MMLYYEFFAAVWCRLLYNSVFFGGVGGISLSITIVWALVLVITGLDWHRDNGWCF